jgi:hypothetical protein
VSRAITAKPATANQTRRLKRAESMADHVALVADQGAARPGQSANVQADADVAPRPDLRLRLIRDGDLKFRHRYIALIKLAPNSARTGNVP